MTKIHIIGAGTPTPTPERFESAWVIETLDDYVMFDCGPATTHNSSSDSEEGVDVAIF